MRGLGEGLFHAVGACKSGMMTVVAVAVSPRALANVHHHWGLCPRFRYEIGFYLRRAPGFEQQRAVPAVVPQLGRTAVLAALGYAGRPRILDMGAGSGRFGWPFVAADDD